MAPGMARVPARQPYLNSDGERVSVAGFRPAEPRRLCRANSPLASLVRARDLYPKINQNITFAANHNHRSPPLPAI